MHDAANKRYCADLGRNPASLDINAFIRVKPTELYVRLMLIQSVGFLEKRVVMQANTHHHCLVHHQR